MKIIYNKLIPFKGFLAINLFGVFFIRKNDDGSNPVITKRTINHESIHTAQQKELLYVGFYLLYLLFWLWNLIFATRTAYRSIPFEIEAYTNEYDFDYLKNRKKYAWIKTMKISK